MQNYNEPKLRGKKLTEVIHSFFRSTILEHACLVNVSLAQLSIGFVW